MMFLRKGMTLMEIIIVLILISVAAVFTFPNFITPTEHARAINAKNNLLAIYGAQQNYITNNVNNNNSYCTSASPSPCSTLAEINTVLGLNIEDDGTYHYQCLTATTCTATRTISPLPLTLTLTLNTPIKVVLGGGNPACVSTTGNSNWCP
jgi:prepilin-type N-terminal cleavage/methylation domain-containing protein